MMSICHRDLMAIRRDRQRRNIRSKRRHGRALPRPQISAILTTISHFSGERMKTEYKTPEQMAIEIADETAVLDIESICRRVKHPESEHGTDPWWDTSDADPVIDGRYVQRALQYLEARGRIERHPRYEHIIRILPEPQQ